ncbi:transcriptional regulator, TetR family [Peptoclostridium litorale DSM 5388]|uniref:HTH tetR-type domain-containing protein n=1 Tax=Peptoclostridium litorale DSM 5388 TaxID=1121324 RepID=A0A069RPQ2_PEPLI|nr:TetR/AcrR family transcriptional regulator [Peptoclostridium litorale]KDR96132.1 hypothetical protein CLIT_5c01440 [Peptoclostridium litorale DSM 5388]SIO03941.1 transcriptional regulator, TetR family [Peptoclostridium litorale DSM 5388]
MKKNVRKDEIRNIAKRLFIENGVKATSVNEIVKEAGIAKGTFYIYYNCKDELIDEVFNEISIDFIKHMFVDIEHKNNVPKDEAVDHIVDRAVEGFEKNREFLEIMKNDISNNKEFKYKRNFIEQFKHKFESSVNISINEGVLDSDVTLYIIVDMFIGACYNAIILGTPYTIGEVKKNLKGIIHKVLK